MKCKRINSLGIQCNKEATGKFHQEPVCKGCWKYLMWRQYSDRKNELRHERKKQRLLQGIKNNQGIKH